MLSKNELLGELELRIKSTDPSMAQLIPEDASVEDSISRLARHKKYIRLWKEVQESDENDAIVFHRISASMDTR